MKSGSEAMVILRWQAAATCLALLAWSVSGCREESDADALVLRNSTQRGPLTLMIEVSPRELQIGDRVSMRLIAETPAGYDAVFPSENAFGDLNAHEVATADPKPGVEGLVWQREFAFEPLISGSVEVPPLTVQFTRETTATGESPSETQELTSKPLTIEVTSSLAESDDPSAPRDITGVLPLPADPMPAWQTGLIVGAIAGVLAGGYAGYRAIRRRSQRPPPPIPPELWALRALQELDTADWLSPERMRLYYYRLTEIVRAYIELKFGLAAPEMTTEEFLAMLARDQGALPYDAERLQSFLQACDYVKYAALSPLPADAQAALTTARAFVDATAAAYAARAADTPGGQAA